MWFDYNGTGATTLTARVGLVEVVGAQPRAVPCQAAMPRLHSILARLPATGAAWIAPTK